MARRSTLGVGGMLSAKNLAKKARNISKKAKGAKGSNKPKAPANTGKATKAIKKLKGASDVIGRAPMVGAMGAIGDKIKRSRATPKKKAAQNAKKSPQKFVDTMPYAGPKPGTRKPKQVASKLPPGVTAPKPGDPNYRRRNNNMPRPTLIDDISGNPGSAQDPNFRDRSGNPEMRSPMSGPMRGGPNAQVRPSAMSGMTTEQIQERLQGLISDFNSLQDKISKSNNPRLNSLLKDILGSGTGSVINNNIQSFLQQRRNRF